jgi:hypothetical protein
MFLLLLLLIVDVAFDEVPNIALIDALLMLLLMLLLFFLFMHHGVGPGIHWEPISFISEP